MSQTPREELLIDFTHYGSGLGEAVAVVRNNAVAAGLSAPVPTCPGWTVNDLVIHLGTAQRWASGILGGQEPAEAGIAAQQQADAIAAGGDVLDWLDDGLVDLLNDIVRAPADLQAFFFLKNAPAARTAWARRQCHEATIHAVDAMSSRLGAAPQAAQTWIKPDLAVDGLDELLRGFLPRRTQKVRSDEPMTVVVRALDAPHGPLAWLLQISQEPVQVSVLREASAIDAAAHEGDVVVEGSAVALYLGLWNRGSEMTVTGQAEWIERWREQMRIVWS